VITNVAPPHEAAQSPAPFAGRDSISEVISSVLVALWFAGILLIAGIAWGRTRERRTLLSALMSPPSEKLEQMLIRLERDLGVVRAVSLALTDCAVGPAVSGTRHPQVYLPRKLAESLSDAQLQSLLAHELVHVRRGDAWIARVQLLAQAVWWFHPAVWWMNRQIDRHRERCCDEEVLASLDGDRSTYASCLLDVLTAKQTLQPLPWYPGARPVDITARRLEEIMSRSNMVHRRTPAWCWTIALALAVPVLLGGQAGVANQDQRRAADSKASQPSGQAIALLPAQQEDKEGEKKEDKKKEKAKEKSSDEKKRAADKTDASILKYGDGQADGKKSIAGTGEMIRFELPDGVTKVGAIKVHGSRYGYPKAPNEDFEITFVKDDFSEVLHTETAPYSTFHRGNSKWHNIKFKKPVDLPKAFWIVLNFNAEQRKGVYVSYDTSTKGEHSRIGLPGDEKPQAVEFGGDWMVQVQTTK
jgi:beta-lactamase regulating signal transducer with metallopeptidase domain